MELPEYTKFIVQFNDLIDERALHKAAAMPVDSYESANTQEVAAALARAQAEFPVIDINRENPWFKTGYSDLDIIMRTLRPILGRHGLSVTMQTRLNDNGSIVLHTRLRHEGGQWIESRSRINPPKNDAQSYASTLNYHKRYAVMSLLAVTVMNDPDDDDAEVAMVEARNSMVIGPSTHYDATKRSGDVINRQQLEELEYELTGHADLAEEVLTKLHIRSLADMPKDQYRASITRIREIKEKRKTGGLYGNTKT